MLPCQDKVLYIWPMSLSQRSGSQKSIAIMYNIDQIYIYLYKYMYSNFVSAQKLKHECRDVEIIWQVCSGGENVWWTRLWVQRSRSLLGIVRNMGWLGNSYMHGSILKKIIRYVHQVSWVPRSRLLFGIVRKSRPLNNLHGMHEKILKSIGRYIHQMEMMWHVYTRLSVPRSRSLHVFVIVQI